MYFTLLYKSFTPANGNKNGCMKRIMLVVPFMIMYTCNACTGLEECIHATKLLRFPCTGIHTSFKNFYQFGHEPERFG